MDNKEIIGILGGTFNPIHNGHIALAKLAHEQFNIPVIYIMPSGNPASYKKINGIASAKDRCNMIEAAITQFPYMKLSTVEVERSGITYTADTLKEMHNQYKKIYFIIGADSLLYLDKWKNPEYICSHCTLIVANRNNEDMNILNKKKLFMEKNYGAEIEFIKTANLPYSSTYIRKCVYEKRSIENFVPNAVKCYIYQKGLYTQSTN